MPVRIMFLGLLLLSSCSLNDGKQGVEKRFWISENKVACEAVGPWTCLQVKEAEDAEWTLFYDGIEGFTHIDGTSYIIEVRVDEVPDPPADGSSLKYTLLRILEQCQK